MKSSEYDYILVESFKPIDTSTRHGLIHIRPLPDQEPYDSEMFVACSKDMSNNYPVGTKFRIKAKITSREGGTAFIYSHYSWPYEVIQI